MTAELTEVNVPDVVATAEPRRRRFEWFLTPATLTLVPVVLSFIAWRIPWPASVNRGFTHAVSLTFGGALFLIVWYGSIVLVGTLAWRAGRAMTPKPLLERARDVTIYRVVTVTALVGVLGSYVIAELNRPGVLHLALSSNQFNLIRGAIPYSAGPATFRYASILAGGIALYRLIALFELRLVHLLNLVLLAGNVLIASRLSLMIAMLIAVALVISRGMKMSRLAKYVIVGAVVAAISLVGLANYLRNAGFYENQKIDNPAAMLLSETVRYLGAPSQVAVATANAHAAPPADNVVEAIGQALIPSFVRPHPSVELSADQNWYRSSTTLDGTLTTNSAVADLFAGMSWWAFLVVLLPVWLGAYLMGHFSRYRNYLVAGAAVTGYCFAEIWRTFLFSEGIVWFCILILVAACFLEPGWSLVRSTVTKLRRQG